MVYAVTTQTLLDGVKNCAVKITGFVQAPDSAWRTVVELERFKPKPQRVKIDHMEWAITGRIEVLVAWHSREGERELIAPLSGRGSFSFSDYGGLSNVLSGHSGHIELCTQDSDAMKKGMQAFVLLMDLIKQEEK